MSRNCLRHNTRINLANDLPHQTQIGLYSGFGRRLPLLQNIYGALAIHIANGLGDIATYGRGKHHALNMPPIERLVEFLV